MPNYELTAPDGKKYQVTAPDGATQDQVLAYAKAHWGGDQTPQQKAPSVAAPQSPTPETGPLFQGYPITSGPKHGMELGLIEDWDRAAEALARGAGDVAHAFGDTSWTPGKDLTAKDVAAEQAFRKLYGAQPQFGGNEIAGEIGATLPAALFGGEIPGAIGLGARLLSGASSGLVTGAPGAAGALKGAAIGLGLSGLGETAASAVRHWVRPEARDLMAAGVRLTPGQMRGGIPNSIEEKMAGTVPLTGDLIKRARDQSVHDFNTATINKALAPIGEKLSGAAKSGYEAVAEAGDKLDAAYNALLEDPKLKFVATAQYADDIDEITKEAKTLPAAQRDQLTEIVNYALNDPQITGQPTGRQLKKGLATLGVYARRYASSPLPEVRHMSQILRDYQTALRDNLARTNPQAAGKLSALDNGWAQLVRIENAAGRRATSDGVFTPSDLLQAEKNASNSVRKRSFARGHGLLQDWARNAQKVIPSKIPDSGTAGRVIMERTLAGMAGLAAGAEMPRYAIPAAAGIAASALPYTKMGIAGLNAAANPAFTDPLAHALSNAGRYSAGPISGLVNADQQTSQ